MEFLICLNRTQGVAVWGELTDDGRPYVIYRVDLLTSTLTAFHFDRPPTARLLPAADAFAAFERAARLPRVEWPLAPRGESR